MKKIMFIIFTLIVVNVGAQIKAPGCGYFKHLKGEGANLPVELPVNKSQGQINKLRFKGLQSKLIVKKGDLKVLFGHTNKYGCDGNFTLVKLNVIKKHRYIVYNHMSKSGNKEIEPKTSAFDSNTHQFDLSELEAGEYAFVAGKTPYYVYWIKGQKSQRKYFTFSIVD